jgi:4-amino-4-deoxy-L-arabinose transferase-like glycosyltransferase
VTQIEAAPHARLAARRLSVEEVLLLIVIVYFLGLRVLHTAVGPPFLDEPYYWMWGRHLALSYFDHPPMGGWVQWLSYALFGRSSFALRWPTWVALAIELWVFYRVARRLSGDDWRPVFLRTTAVFLASPLFGFFLGLAFHEYLLIAFVMASGWLFVEFFAEVEEGKRGSSRLLFGAAAVLGLAVLSKYNGALLGIAVAGAVLIRPKLRPLLLDWRLWAAAALAIGMQAPVLMWNFQHGFESFLYQAGSRHGTAGLSGVNFDRIKQVALGPGLIMLSPFLVPVIIRFFWARQPTAYERIGKTIAIWLFWPSTLLLIALSNVSWVMPWWNNVAYAMILPFTGRYTRPILLGVHIAYGLFINTFATITYSVVPVLMLFGAAPGMETESMYGWPRIAERVVELKAEYGAQYLAMNNAQTAAELAYALDDPTVLAITPQRNTFDDWIAPGERLGETFIVVENVPAGPEWRQSFGEVTEIDRVQAEVWGNAFREYVVYLAKDFRGMQ